MNSFSSSDYSSRRSLTAAITKTERFGFALYSLEINDGRRNWVVYRRYSDFVRLNKKIKKAAPYLQLKLPPKRVFRSNFDNKFLLKRKVALEDFMRKLFSISTLMETDPIRSFFRLDNPPKPENLVIETSFDSVLTGKINERNTEMDQQFITLSSELDRVISEMTSALSSLGEVKIEVGGKITEVKEPEIVEQKEALRKTLEKAKRMMEDHLGIYKREVEELTSQLHTERAVVSQMTYQYDSELAEMSYVKSKKQKYLFSLLLGVQLSMALSGRPIDPVNVRVLQILFAQIKDKGIAIKYWPSWVQQKLQE